MRYPEFSETPICGLLLSGGLQVFLGLGVLGFDGNGLGLGSLFRAGRSFCCPCAF